MRRTAKPAAWLPVLGLLLLGAALRLLWLEELPPGLNQDEASEGYEAWALLHSGMDRNGNAWPALFVSWGSGQNVLYAYLAMPFVALFGLSTWSVRLVSAVAGTLTLPVMGLLGFRLRGKEGGYAALALTALCPWHVMLSRWALESNLLPGLLLAGILCAVLSLNRPWALVGAGAAFGLSLYAYGTAFVFLPLYLVPAFVYLLALRKIPLRVWLAAFGVFVLLALPITLTNLRNVLGLGECTILGVTLPALTVTRQAATTALGQGAQAYWANAGAFWQILRTQTDGLPFNAVSGRMFLPGTLLMAALGLGESLYRLIRRRLAPGEALLLLTVPAVAVSAFVIAPNINRMNMAFLPILYLAASGFAALFRLLPRRWLRLMAVALCAAVAVCAFASFARLYVTETRQTLRVWFFDDLEEAVVYADELGEPVLVTDMVNMPYIYVLFWTRTPPETFAAEVVYRNPQGDFRQVSSFGKWRFGGVGEAPPGSVAVATKWEAVNGTLLADFGEYVVYRVAH